MMAVRRSSASAHDRPGGSPRGVPASPVPDTGEVRRPDTLRRPSTALDYLTFGYGHWTMALHLVHHALAV